MTGTKRNLVVAACLLLLVGVAATAHSELILYDDSDDNDVSDWDLGPLPGGPVALYGRPAASGGKIWGIGSGYAQPHQTWMVTPAVFDATVSLALQVRGWSGTQWSNQATMYVFDDQWPEQGYPWTGAGQYNGVIVEARLEESYQFNVYGEAN